MFKCSTQPSFTVMTATKCFQNYLTPQSCQYAAYMFYFLCTTCEGSNFAILHCLSISKLTVLHNHAPVMYWQHTIQQQHHQPHTISSSPRIAHWQ